MQVRKEIDGKSILLLASESFYRNAILYEISKKISVVPSIDSILKDQNSRNYVLLTRPSGKNPPFNCMPFKAYHNYNSAWFPPIRYEDRIADTQPVDPSNNLLVLYNLSECLDPVESRFPTSGRRSTTEIGENYAATKPGMTSLTRIHFRTGLDYLNND